MNKLARWFFTAVGILILIGIFGPDPKERGGRSSYSIPPAQATAPVARVSASSLIRAYEANEIAADQAYKGQIIAVDGTVESIAKGLFGEPYIVLGIGKILQGVRCSFRRSDQDALAQLRKGQKVTVVGEVDGKFMHVQLSDCELAADPPVGDGQGSLLPLELFEGGP